MSGETQQVGQITDSQGSSASADQRAGPVSFPALITLPHTVQAYVPKRIHHFHGSLVPLYGIQLQITALF